jgi:poly(A) polymerase
MATDATRSLLGIPLGRRIHDVLKAHGGEVRLVGGVVRDALAGQQIPDNPDLDMAMTMTPERAMAVLNDDGLHVIPTGLDHGTITVLEKGDHKQKIELTTLRIDVDTDGRHADVAFTEDWVADAARRDFTINALYLDYDGVLFDPVGGQDDLRRGRVRFIGKAEDRIKEDYLRMLRFFRFNARFAESEPNKEAMDAIAHHAKSLLTISGERIARELDQLIMLGADALSPMMATGLDRSLTPSGFNIENYVKFLKSFKDINAPSLAGRYAVLIGFDQITDFAERLKMSKVMHATMLYIAMPIDDVSSWDDQNWPGKAWFSLSERNKSWWRSRYLAERFVLAGLSKAHISAEAIIDGLLQWSPPEFPVKGQDLIESGFNPGEEIGVILSRLEKIWVDSDFTTSKDDLLQKAETLGRDSAQRENHGEK